MRTGTAWERHFALIVGIFLCTRAGIVLGAPAEDVLAKSRAVYAGLESYSDTGEVIVEFGPARAPLTERHSFTTCYRAPRQFFFEFKKDPKVSDERLVVWGDGESFHQWWSTTGQEENYPRGSGANAFIQSGFITKGSVLQIAPLIFRSAGLPGTLVSIPDASADGVEDVAGRPCFKFVGLARDVYSATGREVNKRRTTVWIDQESLLVLKVFEDTPQGTAAGIVMRVTTTFSPQLNPSVDESRFHFVPPAEAQQR